MRIRALLLALSVLSLTACGEGGDARTFLDVRNCLDEAGVTYSADDDDLTTNAADAEAAVSTDEGIEVILEENEEAADRSRGAYARIVEVSGGKDEDVQQFGAAYVYFPKGDETREAKRVRKCVE